MLNSNSQKISGNRVGTRNQRNTYFTGPNNLDQKQTVNQTLRNKEGELIKELRQSMNNFDQTTVRPTNRVNESRMLNE